MIGTCAGPPVPEMTRREELMWCELVEQRCGISFPETRLYILRNCVRREMWNRGIETHRDFYRLVAGSDAEWSRLADRLVNRETCFLRHSPSFTALAEEIVPVLIREKFGQKGKTGAHRDRSLALWSAGCSSGDEAYSLAIACSEAASPLDCRTEVLGSDLSGEALAAARGATYTARAIANVPAAWVRRYFHYNQTGYGVIPAIQAMVRFELFNLFDTATYPPPWQDVIFCQNVFIYFREEKRLEAACNLAACLRPGGFLVPAPGELAGLTIPGLDSLRLRHTVVLRRNGALLKDIFHLPPAAKCPAAGRPQEQDHV